MESIQPWIGPLIEHCLSLYSQGQLDHIQVEDDGSNLRFKVPSERHAMITAWDNVENWTKARITDQLTQLDAIISEESLEVYNRSYPHRPVNIKEARGCCIQLLDFEMVLEYAASSPGIHLYVKRFDVAWEGFRYKGPVPGRLPKKSKELMEWINQAFGHARSAGKGGHAPKEPRFYGSSGSLQGHASQAPGTQSVLMTQVPSDLHARHLVDSSQATPLPVNSDQLLGHLGGRAHVSQNGSPPQAPSETGAQRIGVVGTDQTNGNGVSIKIDSGPTVQRHVQLPDPVSVSRYKTPDRNIPSMGEHTKDKTEGCTDPTQKPDLEENVEKNGKSPAQIGTPTQRPTDSEYINTLNPRQNNPWEGMTMISKKDVEIPKDQRKLFEQHLRRWIPASPAKDEFTGNVPAALLHHWNKIALKRHLMAQQPGPKSSTSKSVVSHDALPDTPNRSPESDSESDQGSAYSNWSASDTSMRDASPSPRIPADSPIRERPRVERPNLRRPELDSTHNQPEADAEPEQDIQIESPPQQGAKPDRGTADGDTGLEDTRAHIQETHESDNESGESTMETSVPCALGSNSQQTNPASQPENGVNSSGSAHEPFVREHVQVVETPAKQRRPAKPKEGRHDTDSGSQPLGQSSLSGPNSSQSRILNTYASKNGDPKGTQETNVSFGTEDGSNNTDILGTQLSVGHWSMQGTTFSQSDMVLDSSGARNREQSVGVINSTDQSEESSRPFSSYREVLHSTQSGDMDEDGSGPSSSLPDLLVEHARRSALKRGVSEVDNDLSMVKRFKAQHEEDNDVNRSVSEIVTRRKSYISGSPEHFEAQRIHEKFRSAYPSYTGDFFHFTELCSVLRTLRSQGNLTRSFLWDDFVIKHLQDYPQHREQSCAAETKPLPYEEFFLSTYNKPSYKKRDLTVKSIEVAAAQHVPLSQPSSVHQADAKVSFTGSLVDRFSNFHAHSFGPASQSGQTDPDIDRMPSTQSTDSQEDTQAAAEEQLLGEVSQASARGEAEHARSGINEEHRTAPRNQAPEGTGTRLSASPTESHYDDATEERRQSRAPEALPTRSASASESGSCYKDAMDETRASPAGETGTQIQPDHHLPPAAPPGPTIELSIPDSESESIYDDAMDETHETASIELGDVEDKDQDKAAGPSTADAKGLPEGGFESESENENWFDSLRHIWGRPDADADPPWSDDRNTPFKTWARETLNVKSEVKRRGWAYAVDERGVIQRPR